MPDDDRPTAAELAARIEAADGPSKPQPQRLRLQWNVPRGVQPYIPLWLALTFIGLMAVVILTGLLAH
jgi:hypothetical protein